MISNAEFFLGALPEQTCPEHSYPDQSTPSGGQNSQHLQNQVQSLASDVTSLHNKMLEQSHMLSQLQSVLISFKNSNDSPSDQTNNSKSNTEDPHNQRRDNYQNLTSAIETVKLQLSSFQETTVTLDGDMLHLRETVAKLSSDVVTLQGKAESFQTFMDTNKPVIDSIRSEINNMKRLGVYCYMKGTCSITIVY